MVMNGALLDSLESHTNGPPDTLLLNRVLMSTSSRNQVHCVCELQRQWSRNANVVIRDERQRSYGITCMMRGVVWRLMAGSKHGNLTRDRVGRMQSAYNDLMSVA